MLLPGAASGPRPWELRSWEDSVLHSPTKHVLSFPCAKSWPHAEDPELTTPDLMSQRASLEGGARTTEVGKHKDRQQRRKAIVSAFWRKGCA